MNELEYWCFPVEGQPYMESATDERLWIPGSYVFNIRDNRWFEYTGDEHGWIPKHIDQVPKRLRAMLLLLT